MNLLSNTQVWISTVDVRDTQELFQLVIEILLQVNGDS